MRDSKEKKKRDMRKAMRGCYHPYLWQLFRTLHPEFDNGHTGFNVRNFNDAEWCVLKELYDIYDNTRNEWLTAVTGLPASLHFHMGSPPSVYRRCANATRRAKEKQALRDAVAHGTLDDVVFPRFRRDIRYNYW